MKAKFFLPLVFLLIVLTAITTRAQRIVPGITAGASINSVKIEGIPNAISDDENLTGIEAGLYMKFNALGWYVQPMAIASFVNGNVSTRAADGTKELSDFKMSNLEVPVIVGWKMFRVIGLEAGPTWNYLMSYSDEINGVKLDLSRNTLGYRAGVRISIYRFGLFGHYGGVIYEQDNSDFSLERPHRLIFGATLDLGGGE